MSFVEKNADEATLTEVASLIHKRMQVRNTHAKMKTLRMLETLLAIESFRKNLKLNGTLVTLVDDATSLISFEDPAAEEMQINAIRGVASKVAQVKNDECCIKNDAICIYDEFCF